jgi:mRNA-degrading endonuclease toxin of MazEF toxin-antitoxin module
MAHGWNKGDVVMVNLGSPPNEVVGHEQGYVRPCLVLKSFDRLSLAIVVPITSSSLDVRYYPIVKLPKGVGGLDRDSCALCHQIRTIAFARMKFKLGTLDRRHIEKVNAVLVDALEL